MPHLHLAVYDKSPARSCEILTQPSILQRTLTHNFPTTCDTLSSHPPHPTPPALQVFTISGAIAQWYYTPVGAAPVAGRSRTLLSLGHALGPSFGSLCLGGLLLALIAQLRSMLQNAQVRRGARLLLLLEWQQ